MMPWFTSGVLLMGTVLLMAALFGLGVHEVARFKESTHICERKSIDNERALKNLCPHALDERVKELCESAERAALLSNWMCAWRHYWQTSGVSSLYARVTETNVIILAVVIAIVFTRIYAWFFSSPPPSPGPYDRIPYYAYPPPTPPPHYGHYHQLPPQTHRYGGQLSYRRKANY